MRGMDPVGVGSDGQSEEKKSPASVVSRSTPANGAKKRSNNGSQGSLVLYTVVALGIALFVRFFVATPYVVSGASMEPNFQDWNYLIVDRLSYELGTPQRGDIIVFNLPEDTSRALIKRVIGLPGDTVVLSGPNPTVTIINAAHPQGFTLSEPYIDSADYGGASDMRVTLGPDQYFVLGDNRVVSADSRLWGILPKQDIVGRVLLRLYPLQEISILPAQARYSASTTPAQQ